MREKCWWDHFTNFSLMATQTNCRHNEIMQIQFVAIFAAFLSFSAHINADAEVAEVAQTTRNSLQRDFIRKTVLDATKKNSREKQYEKTDFEVKKKSKNTREFLHSSSTSLSSTERKNWNERRGKKSFIKKVRVIYWWR